MTKPYDPLEAPTPEEWLDMDEQERLHLIEDYHRRAGIHLPNVAAHASLHCIVENQLTLGDAIPVRKTLERLMREGVDRHEAIHAVASVLCEHMVELVRDAPQHSDPNAPYFAALGKVDGQKLAANLRGVMEHGVVYTRTVGRRNMKTPTTASCFATYILPHVTAPLARERGKFLGVLLRAVDAECRPTSTTT
jgi:Domain of unknown function (DUF1841)